MAFLDFEQCFPLVDYSGVIVTAEKIILKAKKAENQNRLPS